VLQKSTTGSRQSVSLRFALTQHSRDEVLMNSLIDCLSCGRYSSGRDEGYFIVSNLSDVCAKIIPPWHALRFFLFAPFLPPLMKCIRGGKRRGAKKYLISIL
jgi:hypothetical protein